MDLTSFTYQELVFLRFLLVQERLRYSQLSSLFKENATFYDESIENIKKIDTISHKITLELKKE